MSRKTIDYSSVAMFVDNAIAGWWSHDATNSMKQILFRRDGENELSVMQLCKDLKVQGS